LVLIAGFAAILTSESVGLIIASNAFACGQEFWNRLKIVFV
jgi:hypothetical protein